MEEEAQGVERVETVEGVETQGVEGLGPSPRQGTEEDQVEKPVEEGGSDDLTALRQELEEARAKEAEYLDGWQRARAELSNARKRFQREQEQSYANAKADVLARLLPVVDDFERAFETLPDNLSSLTWIEGLVLIQRELQLLLEQAGVMPIEAGGQEFDPLLHQAVTHEPCETVPAGNIIGELQKGYKMGDRVLRPSVVRVSSGPSPESDSADHEADQKAEVEASADDEQA